MVSKKNRFFSGLTGAIVLSLTLMLSGCSEDWRTMFDITQDAPDLEYPAKDLIIKGMDDYNVGDYWSAATYFQEIIEKYPFSPEAPLAELKVADSHYYMGKYIEAYSYYEEFENRHPTNEAIPYVMFQKGMCYFKQLDRVDRDPVVASRAVDLFNQLQRAFPESPYTEAAKTNSALAKEFLANHEYAVVEFYLRTGKTDQAETRLRYLLTVYPDSEIAPKAMEVLEQIEAGNPPRRPVLSWFPDFDLPNWGEAAEDEANTTANQAVR